MSSHEVITRSGPDNAKLSERHQRPPAALFSSSPPAAPPQPSSWGLPSAGCPGNWTHYWTHIYPQQHREWRAQGRVVVHCTEHTGLGNYLRSLTSALVYSMVTEQALTLRCDRPELMQEGARTGRPVDLPMHLARFFRGPHFDWAFPPNLPENAPTVSLYATQMSPALWAWNATHGSRVTSTLATWPRRMLQFSKSMPYFTRYFGRPASAEILRKDINLDGCLLRYLLQPRHALVRAVHKATGAVPDSDRLVPIAAMHVREGDQQSFSHAGWQTRDGRWWMSHDVRYNSYDASPVSAFECLARLSSAVAEAAATSAKPGLPLAHGPAERHLVPTKRAQWCAPCVVLSDSVAVEQCAQRLLDGPITTPGASVHLSASSNELASNETNIQRMFLDWFLLAQSASTLFTTAVSTFETTAWSFKVSSASNLHGKALADDARGRGSSTWPHVLFRDSVQWKDGRCVGSARLCELLFDGATRRAPGLAAAEDWWRTRCRPG